MHPFFAKRKLLWIIGGFVTPIIGAAIVVSCGEIGEQETTNGNAQQSELVVKPNLANLQKVKLIGNARVFNVVVPTEVTHVNDSNEFSATGNHEALVIYGNLTIIGFEGYNSTKMPIRVLRAYLAASQDRRIEMRGNDFFLIDEDAPQGVNLVMLYNSTFNFTRNNYAPHWPEHFTNDHVALSYMPAAGYKLEESAKEATPLQSKELLNYADFADQKQPLTTQLTSKLREELASTSNSTPGDVHWLNRDTAVWSGTFSAIFSNIQFSKSINGPWSSLKPTNILDNNNVAHLFALFTPTPSYSITPNQMEVTSLIELNKWRQVVSVPSSFDGTQIALNAREGNLVVDTSRMSLPVNTRLEFEYGSNADWMDYAELVNSLSTSSLATLRSIRGRLAPIDDQHYLNEADQKPFAFNTSALVAFEDTGLLTRLLGEIKIDVQSSTGRSDVKWSAVPSFSQVTWQSGISFLASDLNITEVASASGWSTSLPTGVIGTSRQARIYARVVVQPGVLVRGGVIFDITDTSLFSQLLTLVNLRDLTNLLFSLNLNLAASHSDRLAWVSGKVVIPDSLSEAVQSVEYLSGDYATQEAAVRATGWTSELPTQVSYNANARHLWARVAAKPGYRFERSYFDLTQASDIANVRSVFNPTLAIDLENTDLSRIIFSANNGVLKIDESEIVLPTGLEIRYFWPTGNLAGSTATDLINNMLNQTSFDFANLQARVQAKDPLHYLVINSRVDHPNINAVAGLIDTMSFINATKRIAIDEDNSGPNRRNEYVFSWSNVPAVPTSWQGRARVEYLLGVYPLEANALTAVGWSSTMPTIFTETNATPNLWVRIVGTNGWVVNKVRPENLTMTSGLDGVFQVINVKALIDRLLELRVDINTSTTTRLNWVENTIVREVPNSVLGIRYLLTDLFNEATDKENSEKWSSNLPTLLENKSSGSLVLWARLVPSPGFRITQTEIELTRTSGIQQVNND